ncbi:CRISPR-associated helicase/endonuclease Cas3 [Streptococcus thoraltensis]|uniref:CRISPR-associated helicase/endonuclease Cas3 n=1 Tax=Streptococcus thoraltensis TaxID=55085 RepID=UPI0004761415|nr:CRISPR-associated helicase/endonuclease Cas3 [Streptococcus thoraltensis]MDY4761344.1 CRISPR-associated helicase/endonuclease Cas3 [Streptococcus thoraltensis]
MNMWAHYNQETNQKQSLEEHSFNVAVDARQGASSIDQGDVLFLLGLYHDLGKTDPLFQNKLYQKPSLQVDHSYAGAKYLYGTMSQIFPKAAFSNKKLRLFKDIVTYVIAAHHGMYDIPFDGDQDAQRFGYNKTFHRIMQSRENYAFNPDVLQYAQQLESSLPDCGYDNLQDLLEQAWRNFQLLWEKLSPSDESEEAFYAGCIVRLYLSLLKNADILDTINAYDFILELPSLTAKQMLIQGYRRSVEELYASFGQAKTPINRIRTTIANRVKERGASDLTGVYRLNLPTGAGKTNLSLQYATQQMTEKGKKRFFYITPFLSVLEQNASAMKKVLGEEGVLEHHSNVVKESTKEELSDEKAVLLSDYLLDSWDSPVVLTSMVQFFQTLVKTKSSNIRRFASLIDSVVILDEVQSLPIEVTTIFNLTLNFLSQVMNTTIVLCTATQPTYGSDVIKHRLFYAEEADIVTVSPEELEVFTRTELRKFDETNGKTSLGEIADFVLSEEKSTLIILNTKKSVDKLYKLLENQTERPLYQLSTNMCPQHRLDVIKEIKKQLKEEIPLICVSTQLIEAGVDVDFEQVVRSYAGIDSIVQASGRCNREGKRDKGHVTLVNLTDNEENLSRLKEIRHKKDATENIIEQYRSPIDVAALNDCFFEKYYADHKDDMDYPIGDNETGYDYLSCNTFAGGKTKADLCQSFKRAGRKIDLIKDDSVSVLVSYGKAEEAIAVLEDLLNSTDYPTSEQWLHIKQLLNELQLYTVNLRNDDELLAATKSYLDGRVLILQEQYYDKVIGVKKEAASFIL